MSDLNEMEKEKSLDNVKEDSEGTPVEEKKEDAVIDSALFNSMAFPDEDVSEPVVKKKEKDFQYDEVPEEEFELVADGIQAKRDNAEIKAFVEKEMKEIAAAHGLDMGEEPASTIRIETPVKPVPVVEAEMPVAPVPVVEAEMPVAPVPVVEAEMPVKPVPVVEAEMPVAPASVVEAEMPVAPAPVVEAESPVEFATAVEKPVVSEDVSEKQEPEKAGMVSTEQKETKGDNGNDSRIRRKNRRIRAQVICYVAAMGVLVVSGVGIAWGFETWTENNRQAKKIAMANKESQMSAAEVLLESEEVLVSPETMESEETVEPVIEEQPQTEPSGGEVVVPETEEQPIEEVVTPGQSEETSFAIVAKEKTAQEVKLDAMIDQMIAEMSLQDKVAGLFIITPEALTKNNTVTKAAGGTKSALTKYPVGGLIYAKKNITAAAQAQTMLKNTKEYATYPLFLAVAEEGGSNGPLANAKVGEKTSSAKEIGATGDAQNAYNAGSLRGEAMNKVGMDLNVLSIGNLANVEESMMDEYAFGADAETAVPYVTEMVKGLSSQGVHVCIGQFPGNGGVSVTEEAGTKINKRGADELKSQELLMFKAAVEAGADIISVGTIAVPSLAGDNTPVVLSSTVVTDLLRNEMNYQGIVITDAMNVPEITNYYGADEAAVLALRAGCDMIYLPEKFDVAYNGVIAAVEDGTIDENRINDALRRIYRVKYADKLTNGEIQ